jgi:prepilin-type N-terminal cleavage/methylation domain-containing protein
MFRSVLRSDFLTNPLNEREVVKMQLHKKHLNAFTLVELLVVISIIALLLAILMPALNKARTAAQTTVCCSNVKQLGMAISLYGTESGVYIRDGMPYDPAQYMNNTTLGYNNNRWYMVLARMGYITKDGKRTPNMTIDKLQDGTYRLAPVFTCPVMSKSINDFIAVHGGESNVNQSSCTYAINGSTMPGEPFDNWAPPTATPGTYYQDQRTMVKVGTLHSPATKIYLACADYREEWWKTLGGSGYFGSYLGGVAYNDIPWLAPYGHGGKNNGKDPSYPQVNFVNEDGQVPTLLADFHVEKVNKPALVGDPRYPFDVGTCGLRWLGR